MASLRAGTRIKQETGYIAFIPTPLPPKPPLHYDDELLMLISQADQELGRLDGISDILPNPDLFVGMFVRHEAVLSSQIEGTQSTLDEILLLDVGEEGAVANRDAQEVVNYIEAMNFGLKRVNELPLSMRLIREIHGHLMEGVRGEQKTPGEFRRSQNWIGGVSPNDAVFVPPPVHEMNAALDNLEKFLHDSRYPALVHCGLVHCQFETIHPFLDGNGRVGRLLITFLLCHRRVLNRPLLYLSLYLKAHRDEYYERLMNVRFNGDWEGWIKFFLLGVLETSRQAIKTSRKILRLSAEHNALVREKIPKRHAPALLALLFRSPLCNARFVQMQLKCSYNTAQSLLEMFVENGLLQPDPTRRRNCIYRYASYLKLFENIAL